jgi:hypothetical protein
MPLVQFVCPSWFGPSEFDTVIEWNHHRMIVSARNTANGRFKRQSLDNDGAKSERAESGFEKIGQKGRESRFRRVFAVEPNKPPSKYKTVQDHS